MARAFGSGEDGDEKGKKPNSGKEQDTSKKDCCCDESDSTTESNDSDGDVIEEAEEGQHLYLDFVRDEIRRNGLETELECLDRQPIVTEIVDPARLMDWTRAGRELRQLADAFSRSSERQTVRKRAQTVAIESLDVDNFFQLLQELFQGGGITRERILVLFFFCADVAIEALRRGFHQTFHNLLGWSLRYIATSVAQYVHSVGGWGVVLRHSLDIAYQVTACCAFLAVVAACVVYIRRNLN